MLLHIKSTEATKHGAFNVKMKNIIITDDGVEFAIIRHCEYLCFGFTLSGPSCIAA